MMKEREYGCVNPIPPAGKNEFFREACFDPRKCVVDDAPRSNIVYQ